MRHTCASPDRANIFSPRRAGWMLANSAAPFDNLRQSTTESSQIAYHVAIQSEETGSRRVHQRPYHPGPHQAEGVRAARARTVRYTAFPWLKQAIQHKLIFLSFLTASPFGTVCGMHAKLFFISAKLSATSSETRASRSVSAHKPSSNSPRCTPTPDRRRSRTDVWSEA